MPIRVLPPEVAAEIAAGEVIERPASAVKELMENALDAGATVIAVEIERGGLDLIRVTDDGRGMTGDELSLAVQRHATSKLQSADDLRTVRTLGFRGEALPSMAAAAEMTLRSRVPGATAGAELVILEGGAGRPRPTAAPPGTSVTLRDLFGRQPARRAFLKSITGETAAVAALVSHLALANPAVRLTLSVDGRRTLETTGSGDARDVAGRVLGVAAARQMLALDGRAGESGIEVHGLVGPAGLARRSRAGISLFVNGRWVQSRRLLYAIESAYDSMLGGGLHPLAVIDLRLPPEELDVNVHPAKSEVRFRNERAVFSALHAAVRAAVAGGSPVPAFSIGAANDEPEADGEAPETALSPSFWPAPAALTPAIPASAPAPATPLLRTVGQVGSTYIITEGPDGMYLIDQHAAHERVLYERILREIDARAPDIQPLLNPQTVELTAAQAAVFQVAAERLETLGFQIEPFGERALLLRAVPSLFAGRDAARAVSELLDALAEPGDATPPADRAPMTLACHAAVRAGMTMTAEEMRELVRLLEQCAAPRTCPHGRPTMMHLSATALDREFKRR